MILNSVILQLLSPDASSFQVSLIGYVSTFTKVLKLLLKRNFPSNLHKVFGNYKVNRT